VGGEQVFRRIHRMSGEIEAERVALGGHSLRKRP